MAKSSRTAVNSNDSSRRVNSLGLVPVVSKLRAASSCRSSTERIFLASFADRDSDMVARKWKVLNAQKLAKVVKRSDCWRSKDEEETASRAGVMRMLRVVPCRSAGVRSACSARARDALWQVRANYVRNVIVGGLLTSLTVPCTETYIFRKRRSMRETGRHRAELYIAHAQNTRLYASQYWQEDVQTQWKGSKSGKPLSQINLLSSDVPSLLR